MQLVTIILHNIVLLYVRGEISSQGSLVVIIRILTILNNDEKLKKIICWNS